MSKSTIADIIDHHESELLNDWIKRQTESLASRRDLVSDAELRTDSRNLLSAMREAIATGRDCRTLSRKNLSAIQAPARS